MLEVRPTGDCSVLTMNTAMTATDTALAAIDRLTRFATDALDLADRRADLDLRQLVDELHADLIQLQEDR